MPLFINRLFPYIFLKKWIIIINATALFIVVVVYKNLESRGMLKSIESFVESNLQEIKAAAVYCTPKVIDAQWKEALECFGNTPKYRSEDTVIASPVIKKAIKWELPIIIDQLKNLEKWRSEIKKLVEFLEGELIKNNSNLSQLDKKKIDEINMELSNLKKELDALERSTKDETNVIEQQQLSIDNDFIIKDISEYYNELQKIYAQCVKVNIKVHNIIRNYEELRKK